MEEQKIASSVNSTRRADSLEVAAYLQNMYRDQSRSSTPAEVVQSTCMPQTLFEKGKLTSNLPTRYQKYYQTETTNTASHWYPLLDDDDGDDNVLDIPSPSPQRNSPSVSPAPFPRSSTAYGEEHMTYKSHLALCSQPNNNNNNNKHPHTTSITRYCSPSASQARPPQYHDPLASGDDDVLGNSVEEEEDPTTIHRFALIAHAHVTVQSKLNNNVPNSHQYPSWKRNDGIYVPMTGISDPPQINRDLPTKGFSDPQISFILQKAAQFERQALMKEAKAEAVIALSNHATTHNKDAMIDNATNLSDTQQLLYFEALQLCVRALEEYDSARRIAFQSSSSAIPRQDDGDEQNALKEAMHKTLMHCEALKNLLAAVHSPYLVITNDEEELRTCIPTLKAALDSLSKIRSGNQLSSALSNVNPSTSVSNILPRKEHLVCENSEFSRVVPSGSVNVCPTSRTIEKLASSVSESVYSRVESTSGRKPITRMHAKVVTAIAPLFMDVINSSYRPQKNTDKVEKTNFVRLSKKLFAQPFCPPCICLPRGTRGFSLGGKILTTENEPLRETLLSSRGELASPPADNRFRNALENMRCNFVDDAIDNGFDTTDKNFQTINDFQPLQTMDSKSKLSGSQHTKSGAADESDGNPVLSHSATPSPAPTKRSISGSKRSKIDGGSNKSGVDYLLRIKHQLEMKKQTEQQQQQRQLDRSRRSPSASTKKATRLQQSTNNASNDVGAARKPFAPKSRPPSALTSRTTSPTLICSDIDYHPLIQPPQLNAVLPHNNLPPPPQHRSIHYFQQQRLPTNNLHEIHELNVDLCKEDKGNVLTRPLQGKLVPVPTSSPALDAVAVRGKPWGGELAERATSAAQRRVPSNSRREALGTLSINMVHEVGNQKMAIICDKEKQDQATTRKSFSEFAFKGSANNGEHSTVNIRTSTPSPKGARKATVGTWKPAKV